MPIKVNTIGHIAKDIQKVVQETAEALEMACEVPHDLLMIVYPSEVVTTDDGDACWATFHEPKPDAAMHIKIAGRFPRKFFPTREHGFEHLVDSVCHEFAHYEQWRDKKPVVERGIAARTRKLIQECKGE